MGKKWKMFLFFGALVVLAGLGSFFVFGKDKTNNLANTNGTGEVAGAVSDQGNNYINRLAMHLNTSSMILYGSNQSAETKAQQDLFGSAAVNLDYVDCDADANTNSSNSDECVGQKITVYPTWVYQGEKFEGMRTLSELAKITNFEQ